MAEETAEATINPDGTYETPPVKEDSFTGDEGDAGEGFGEEGEYFQEENVETDPALYLMLLVFLIVAISIFIYFRSNKKNESDAFFDELDGEKFNLTLPEAVEEYRQVREKVEAAGWEPGKGPAGDPADAANGPHRALAQALMKRCIADIPMVTFIQKESAGMNKLYSQSMCSVKQWRSYQAAENMVSTEVDEVRAEADEIEPGWSQVIWRQAMQYHNMLKQRHEMEAKAAEEAARKQREKKLDPVDAAKQKEIAAEKAAQELIAAEEKEKAFKDGGIKKGFLAGDKKK
mmetsp:Transcript_28999/g.40747  ORF Transcript_28999/g.40747 Transcript_28999/m.40747 type:complete len:289 (+) Transcript_28999:190-1056(+)